MGTSHRHKATIVGQPNWGSASSSVTKLANALVKINTFNDDEAADKVDLRRIKYERKIYKHYHYAIRNYIRAVGGREVVSTGRSRAIGHAGMVLASNFVNAFAQIHSEGCLNWLERRLGTHTLEGKSCQELLDMLKEYISLDVIGLDETAANEAFEHILGLLGNNVDNSVELDDVFNQLMQTDQIKDVIDEFFGMYIFSHLSQNLAEKLEKRYGLDLMPMNEIKDLITEDLKKGRESRSTESINWGSVEGIDFMQKEFDRIIYILSGYED